MKHFQLRKTETEQKFAALIEIHNMSIDFCLFKIAPLLKITLCSVRNLFCLIKVQVDSILIVSIPPYYYLF